MQPPHITEKSSELQKVVQSRHDCDASHLGTMMVEENWGGKNLEFQVEVFAVRGNLPAQYCYAWEQLMASGGYEIVTVLQFPPVISPRTAVLAALKARHDNPAPR